MAAPAQDRANEIVAEARRRVAASGGNPANLQAMIKKVQNEMEMGDMDPIRRRNVEEGMEPRLPTGNNMQQYIDRVLQMSGMTSGQQGGGFKEFAGDAPTPTLRTDRDQSAQGDTGEYDPNKDLGPYADVTSPDMAPDDGSVLDPDTERKLNEAADRGVPYTDLFMIAGGAAGTYAFAKWLQNRRATGAAPYQRNNSVADPAGASINRIAEDADASTNADLEVMSGQNMDQQKQPAPEASRPINVQSNIDEEIEKTLGPEADKIATEVAGEAAADTAADTGGEFTNEQREAILEARAVVMHGDRKAIPTAIDKLAQSGVNVRDERVRNFIIHGTGGEFLQGVARRVGRQAIP